jgi:hypothetical protein
VLVAVDMWDDTLLEIDTSDTMLATSSASSGPT